ncbi:MAG TPA: hypothetical protein VJN95_08785 [Gemmatimonadales bacterium]|nr:hypothetical protein [Gemmatimonadales bacterium]
MAWTRTTGGSASTGVTNVTSLTATLGGAVSVGDTVCYGWCNADSAGSTTVVVDDQLGNTYAPASASQQRDTTNQERVGVGKSIITSAGTPQVRIRYNPTPGTTQGQYTTLVADAFTGSDASSTLDSNGAAQVQATPGTGTDGVSSGNLTTTIADGCLIYAASVSTSNINLNDLTVGTGYTLGQVVGSGTTVYLRTEYKTQASKGAVAGTFTSSANVAHVTAAIAITPAAGGGGSPPTISKRPIVGPDAALMRAATW